MLRRTNSSSHIPLPKHDLRARSRSSVRTSLKDAPSSTKKSTDRLPLPSFKRSTSSSSAFKKSAVTTPTVGSGFKRSGSILSTPSTSRSRSRSPFQLGSAKGERTVNDKKWVSEQFSKVRRYLQEHPSCPEHVPGKIKPPTINTFVFVMELFLKDINPHIQINTTNYKDIVLNTLKSLHYPGNISNSLLKTVNTMHTWPQVVSIFAWLVDLITTIKRVKPCNPSLDQDLKYKKVDCVTDYIIARYLLYNNSEDEKIADKEFGENFVKVLNIDEEESKRLEKEVTKLSLLKENQTEQITEQSNKNDMIKNQIDALSCKLDDFYLNRGQKEEDLKDAISLIKARREKLVKAINIKRENIAKLQETINSQPYTVKEKKKILKHIDELKHSIDLKKENVATEKTVKNNCEIKLAGARKMVETEINRLNNKVKTLTPFEPDLKTLLLKDSNFMTTDFENDIQTLTENIKIFENKFQDEIAEANTTISEMKKELLLFEQRVQSLKKAIRVSSETEDVLNKQIENCTDQIENVNKRRNAKSKFTQQMEQIAESELNIQEIRQNLNELKQVKRKKESDFELLKKHSLEFFVKLHDGIKDNVVNMNNIRSEVFDILKGSLNKVHEVQNIILKDLHEFDALKK